MKYDKGALIQKLHEVRELHMQQVAERELKNESDYDKAMARWITEEKDKAVEGLQRALRDAKANRPFSLYSLRNEIASPPKRPTKTSDATCTPAIQRIDRILEVLDLIHEEEVSSYALERAGIKHLADALRKPC
jgi:hypothetical protein